MYTPNALIQLEAHRVARESSQAIRTVLFLMLVALAAVVKGGL